MADQQAPEQIGSSRPLRRQPELCDVLALGVLAALTLRIVASLAAGAIRIGTHAPSSQSGGTQNVADIIGWFADFGDGFGVVLTGVALGLVWWQVYSVPRTPSPESAAHTQRSLLLCTWTTAVFAATSAASLAYAVADWMSYWDGPERWLHVAGSGFYVSYAVMGVLGVYATRQLFWRALLLVPGEDSGDLAVS